MYTGATWYNNAGEINKNSALQSSFYNASGKAAWIRNLDMVAPVLRNQ